MGQLRTTDGAPAIHKAVVEYLKDNGLEAEEAYQDIDSVCRSVFSYRPTTSSRQRAKVALNKIHKGDTGQDIPGHRKTRTDYSQPGLNPRYVKRFEDGVHAGMAVRRLNNPEAVLLVHSIEQMGGTPSKPSGNAVLCDVGEYANNKRITLATLLQTYEECQHPALRAMRPAIACVGEARPSDMDEYQCYLSWHRGGKQCDMDNAYRGLDVEAAQLATV
jgi:hypothetical protein